MGEAIEILCVAWVLANILVSFFFVGGVNGYCLHVDAFGFSQQHILFYCVMPEAATPL